MKYCARISSLLLMMVIFYHIRSQKSNFSKKTAAKNCNPRLISFVNMKKELLESVYYIYVLILNNGGSDCCTHCMFKFILTHFVGVAVLTEKIGDEAINFFL